MSESEKLIERWSRLKREAAADAPPAEPQKRHDEVKADEIAAARSAEATDKVADKPFDVSSLPSIDSIDAKTDVRAFLQAGVPPDLARAALRRAWTTDPQIRDFVGLVENGWDFNDPNAMHGFGPIEPSDIERLLAQVIRPAEKTEKKPVAARAGGQPETIEDAEQASKQPPGADRAEVPPVESSVQRNDENVAPQNKTELSA